MIHDKIIAFQVGNVLGKKTRGVSDLGQSRKNNMAAMSTCTFENCL